MFDNINSSQFQQAIRRFDALEIRIGILWMTWVFLTIVWGSTLFAMTADNLYIQWLEAGTIVILLYVLAISEGLELAVTDLLDKQPEQLSNVRTRDALRQLQHSPAEFFSNRQLFVVTIITFTTLMTSYPWIYVPLYGRVAQAPIPGLFSFAWTTLTVLWFAQVTPKRLAITNSEVFLGQSVFLLPVIKAAGLLGLPLASNQLVAFFEKFTKYSDKRHLQPSPSAYYNAAGVKSGIAVDRVHVTISMNPDGSGSIRRRSIVCFLHGRHVEHTEAVFCKAGLNEEPKVNVLGLFIGLPPERLETIAQDLDVISSNPHANGHFHLIDHWPYSITARSEPDVSYGGQWARWTIVSGRPLPESYWEPLDTPRSQPMIVLIYEVEIRLGPGALVKDGDSSGREHMWPEYIDVPTRILEVAVKSTTPRIAITLQGCEVRLLRNNATVADETERYSDRAITSHDAKLGIFYPRQGAAYSLHWWCMGDDPLPSLATVESPSFAAADCDGGTEVPSRSVHCSSSRFKVEEAKTGHCTSLRASAAGLTVDNQMLS
jgi:hypothetical protein